MSLGIEIYVYLISYASLQWIVTSHKLENKVYENYII